MSNRYLYLLLAAVLAIGIYIILAFDGTGDSGDSVYHFLIAEGAPHHPELYFDHWGKPFFTLLASPFAQLGFNGIQFFNLLCTLLTIWLTVKTAEALGYQRNIWSGIFLLAAPFVFQLIFSGLTEYLFGALLILGVYLSVKRQFTWAALVISLLPFVRSEGLIIIGVFGLFFLVEKRWWACLWLLFGHVVYGLLGTPVHGSPFWVLGDIPYATPASVYGSGKAFHFVEQLFYVIGPILFGLWIVGLLRYLANLSALRREAKTYLRDKRLESILVVGGFLAYFIAHSIFWYFGIFNSMGLKRVLIAVMPLCAIICLQGWQTIAQLEGRLWSESWLSYAVLAAVLVLPFTSNKSALQLPQDFQLNAEQRLFTQVATYMQEQQLLPSQHRTFYAAPYFGLLLPLDHFNPQEHLPLDSFALQNLQPNDLVLWDNWYAPTDNGITLEDLIDSYSLKIIQEFQAQDSQVVLLKK
ncbi:MAG: glycosyltransferase family 87 protein [Bacteroidota bacterium]